MTSEDWSNIAECANKRVLAKTFSFDDDDNQLIGDLETREMAKMQAYRENLVSSIYLDVTYAIADTFERRDLLEEVGEKKITGIVIDILTE
jgi:hypothetical protein